MVNQSHFTCLTDIYLRTPSLEHWDLELELNWPGEDWPGNWLVSWPGEDWPGNWLVSWPGEDWPGNLLVNWTSSGSDRWFPG